MINAIEFKNYKCLDGKSFPLSNVNVFAGYNGRGKSSVLQSLLMFSQSVLADADIDKLHLCGGLLSLGDYIELLTDDKEEQITFTLKMTEDDKRHNVQLSYAMSLEDEFIGKLKACMIDGIDYFESLGKLDQASQAVESQKTLQTPQWLKSQFQYTNYISADRQGPVKYVERRERPVWHQLDPHGRNVINVLATYKDSIPAQMNVDKDDKNSHSLLEAVSLWMNYIMCDEEGGIDVPEKKMNGHKKSSVLSLEFEMNNSRFSSYHVGFGYSYILSIIEAALIARKGSMVIVENPEAHLHAKAQSRLTLLLSKLSERGVQVFVETHSEHIVNGFRLAALKDESAISNTDLSLFFFDVDFSVCHLEVQPNGRILNWPAGFFDQAKNDLAEIIQLGTKIK